MQIFQQANIYSDFVYQRNMALKAVVNSKVCREVTTWDRVGTHSGMDHNKELMTWIESQIGSFEVINKDRHFNWCTTNPYDFAHIHYDDFDFIVLVYLNLPTQYDPTIDGTRLVRHVDTGKKWLDDQVKADIDHAYADFEHTDTLDDVLIQEQYLMNSDYMNPKKWVTELFIPMESNKAIMFECRHLHSETRNFGKGLTGSRLVEVVYIKTKDK